MSKNPVVFCYFQLFLFITFFDTGCTYFLLNIKSKIRYEFNTIKNRSWNSLANNFQSHLNLTFNLTFSHTYTSSIINRFYSMNWSRILLSVAFVVYCVRMLQIFTIHRLLGPKIIMVGKMVNCLIFVYSYYFEFKSKVFLKLKFLATLNFILNLDGYIT